MLIEQVFLEEKCRKKRKIEPETEYLTILSVYVSPDRIKRLINLNFSKNNLQ